LAGKIISEITNSVFSGMLTLLCLEIFCCYLCRLLPSTTAVFVNH